MLTAAHNKQCKRCGASKPLSEFSPYPSNRDGRHAICKPCRNLIERQRRAARQKPGKPEPEPMCLPGEQWRDIPGLAGYYQVSDQGRVRSLDRYIERKDGTGQIFPGTILKAQRAGGRKRPYLHVSLKYQGERIGVFVHQLVAWAFLGDPPAGHDVHHINGNPTDNRASNLRYVAKAAHLSKHHRGERNPSAILTEADVARIKAHLHRGAAPKALARYYGVADTTIYAIRRGRNWSHVGPDQECPIRQQQSGDVEEVEF